MQSSFYAIVNMERTEIQEDNFSEQKKKRIEIKDFGKDQNIQSDVQKQTGDDLYPEEIAIKIRVNSFKSNQYNVFGIMIHLTEKDILSDCSKITDCSVAWNFLLPGSLYLLLSNVNSIWQVLLDYHYMILVEGLKWND